MPDMKIVKKVEVSITRTEMEQLMEELEECHIGWFEEPDHYYSDVNELTIYLEGCESADREDEDVPQLVREAVTFANRHHVEEIVFTE